MNEKSFVLYWYIPHTDNVTVARFEKFGEKATFWVSNIVLTERNSICRYNGTVNDSLPSIILPAPLTNCNAYQGNINDGQGLGA